MARLRTYLFKSTYEWLLDHNLTPYILVNAFYPDTLVPEAYIEDGQIIFNIAKDAIDNMLFDDEGISFDASFDQELMQVYLPLDSIIALYAEETEQGIYTSQDDFTLIVNEGTLENLDPTPNDRESNAKNPSKRGNLRLIKG